MISGLRQFMYVQELFVSHSSIFNPSEKVAGLWTVPRPALEVEVCTYLFILIGNRNSAVRTVVT
jgi:hypothetical protein